MTHHLLMKANRSLGAHLVQEGLISAENLAEANDLFLKKLRSDNAEEASLLDSLIYGLQVLPEQVLVHHQVETVGLDFLPLSNYMVQMHWVKKDLLRPCMYTRTVPIDQMEDITFLCTAYYLSPTVRQFWEARFGGSCLWFVSTLEEIEKVVYRLYMQNPTLVSA